MQSLVLIGQEMFSSVQFCGFRDFAKNIHRRKWAWPRPKDAADSSASVGTSFWTLEGSGWEL